MSLYGLSVIVHAAFKQTFLLTNAETSLEYQHRCFSLDISHGILAFIAFALENTDFWSILDLLLLLLLLQSKIEVKCFNTSNKYSK